MCCLGPHRSSVCSLEDSSVWVSFYFPFFLNNHAGLRSQPRELFQSFTPAGWMCFAEQRDCCCFHHTGLSDPRPPRRTWAPEKAISSLFPRKKNPKNVEKPQSNLKSSVSSGRHSAYLCHHLSDVFAACRSKTCGHVFPGECRHGVIKANIHQV